MTTSSYRALKASVLRRVEAGDIVPHGDREAVRRAIAGVVAEYQARAHLDDRLTPLGDLQEMVDRLIASVVDLGRLTELLGRDDVEEIQVQGRQVVYWTCDGRVHWLAPMAAQDELRQDVERLLQGCPEHAQLDASTRW